jgi:ankyrin repeat protein
VKYILFIIISILMNGCFNSQRMEFGQAVADGNLNEVRQYIDKGIDVNDCVGYEGCDRPLEVAARYGHIDIIKYLVEHGAQINIKTKTGNAVFWAAFFGKTDVVYYLLSKGGRLVCDKHSLHWWKQNMIKAGRKELEVKVEKTWIAP